MKTIGRMENGNVMVECTPEEVRVFSMLERSVQGAELWTSQFGVHDRVINDLGDAFKAIIEWITIKDRAQSLRNMANEIEQQIGVKS